MDPEEELETDIAQLRGIATFDALDAEALRALIAGAQVRQLTAGEVLFHAGEVADGGYVLTAGRMELLDVRRDGVRRAAMELEPVALIGESALLTRTPRAATAVALTPATLLHLSRAAFLKVLARSPEAATRLRDAVAARLAETLKALDKVRDELENTRPTSRRRR